MAFIVIALNLRRRLSAVCRFDFVVMAMRTSTTYNRFMSGMLSRQPVGLYTVIGGRLRVLHRSSTAKPLNLQCSNSICFDLLWICC